LRGRNHGNFLIVKFVPNIFIIYICHIMPAGDDLTVAMNNKNKHFIILAIDGDLKRNSYAFIVFINLIILVTISFQIYHDDVVRRGYVAPCISARPFYTSCAVK